MRKRYTELFIDELSLSSIPHGGERRLREAVERRLQQMLAHDSRESGSNRRVVAEGPAETIAGKIHRSLTTS